MPTVTPFTVPQTALTAQQASADLALMPNGNVAVAWVHRDTVSGSATDRVLAVRIFQPDGTAVTAEFLDALDPSGRETNPQIVALDDTHFAMFWRLGGAGGNGIIQGRMLTLSNGVLTGSPLQTLSTTPGVGDDGGSPALGAVRMADGRIVIAYDSDGDVVMSTMTADLATGLLTLQVQAQTISLTGGYSMDMSLNGNQVVISRSDGTGVTMTRVTVNANGTLGAASDAGIGVANAQARTVTHLANGDIVIVFSGDYTQGGGQVANLDNGDRLYARVFSSDFTPVTGVFQVNQNEQPTGTGIPEVVAFAGGGFAIIWSQDITADGVDQLNLLMRRYQNAANGYAAVSAPEVLSANATAIRDNSPDAVADAAGNIFLTWERTTNNSVPIILGDQLLAQDPNPVSQAVVETGTGAPDTLDGGADNDTLDGAGGDDILNGGLGADQMTGGTGSDTFYVDDVGDQTLENAGEGTDTVIASLTWTLGANVENLTLTGSGNINGTGNTLANTLTGNDGNNVLDGGDGADKLYGGLGADDLIGGAGGDLLDGGVGADDMNGGIGDDTYVVDNIGDLISETGGSGQDRVRAAISYTLGADLENLQLTGSGNINGTGNTANNQLDGNAGSNTLSGGGGNDIIRGNGGTDDLLGEDGSDMLYGGDGNDEVYGGASNDLLYGEAGEDTLEGGAGVDTLDGGADNDILRGDAGADQLLGGSGDDSLYGGADNDVLTGGAGTDTLYGGTGDDTFIIDAGLDTLVELANEGTDTVRASVSYTLGANIERLNLVEGAGAIDGTGNTLANTMTGNSAANVLNGAEGADIIRGEGGNDTLIGGTGLDILVGGLGADTFLVRQESVFLSSNPQGRTIETDSISDLIRAQGDIVDLSDIDANAATAGINEAFTLVASFSNQAGQMTLAFAAGVTTLLLDVDGDSQADYRLRMDGDVRGDSGFWVL